MQRGISVIGGDLRIIYLIDFFKNAGYDVNIFGIKEGSPSFSHLPENDIKKALKNSGIVILPLPAFKDEALNAPYWDEKIKASNILDALDKDKIVFGGMLGDSFKNELKKRGISFYDYFENETLTLKNAALTAEGGIKLAIEKTNISLSDANCFVFGFGRIGKLLSRNLLSFGAKVTVLARKKSALLEASLSGCDICPLSEYSTKINKADIIFNTIPSVFLDEFNLIKKDAFVIDLASKPGFLPDNAKAILSDRFVHYLSVPGKVAPKSAGKIIFDTIIDEMEDLNAS